MTMTIKTGAKLPEATLLRLGSNGPENVVLSDRLADRRVVIFGLPGAFTDLCTAAHVPSFIATYDSFMAKGVDEIICIAVNDPFVMRAWGESTGATEAGITMLADAESAFTTAIGMNFSAAAVGFVNRSRRYSMLVENGIVAIFNEEPGREVCEISAGETLLAAMNGS